VVEAVVEFYYKTYSNVHRGLHKLSEESTKVYEEAHEKVAKFLNARSWDEVVLTFNTTAATNYIAAPLVERAAKDGKKKVVLTVMEHHSNMLPWRRAAKVFGLKVEYVPAKATGELDLEKAEEIIDEETGVVAVAHASNVTGILNDVRKIAKMAHSCGAVVVVDGAQSVPHVEIDVRALEVDFLTFSGHKMLAPEGTGGFYGRHDLLEELEPWFVGGGAIKDVTLDEVIFDDPPWKFEPGTPCIAASAGLIKAIEYLEKLGMSEIHAHEVRLVKVAESSLKRVDGVKLYGASLNPELRTGIVSFNVEGLHPHVVAKILNDFYGIAVRSGLHCAHPYHRAIGAPHGTVRASFYIYNTPEEAEYLVQAVEEVARKYAPRSGGSAA